MYNKLCVEILRTHQRDDEVINDMSQTIMNILTKLRINKLNFHQTRHVGYLSKFIYYTYTSLSSLQTLGEEYTGLIRVDYTKRYLPNKFVHFLWLMFEVFGHTFVMKFLTKMENIISINDELLPDAKEAILKIIKFFKCCIPYVEKLQKVDFYFNGQYHNIPQRISGINYKCIHPLYNEHQVNSLFQLLGILTLLKISVDLYNNFYLNWLYGLTNRSRSSEIEPRPPNINNSKCVLCLEPRKNNCVTQCGHLFCWDCIGNWCNIRKECPICREKLNSSRNIFLQNYS